MAVSRADHRSCLHPLKGARVLLLVLAWCCAHPAAIVAGPQRSEASSELPIEVDAASTEIDLRSNTALLHRVQITQGNLTVQADEAATSGGVNNFENNQWTFRGHVRLTADGGKLQADEAIVSFANSSVVRAVATGAPASFEQKLAGSDKLAHGRAGAIEYEVATETVRLRNDADLTDGSYDMHGENLQYNIREQKIIANPSEQADQRVHITINPRTPPTPKSAPK
jgi:lipopolysaccharide transport protein LptA